MSGPLLPAVSAEPIHAVYMPVLCADNRRKAKENTESFMCRRTALAQSVSTSKTKFHPLMLLACRARHPSPDNGNSSQYYSVNVGPAHFLMLNSYIRWQNGSAQYQFVQEDLAAYAAANPRLADGTTTGLTP